MGIPAQSDIQDDARNGITMRMRFEDLAWCGIFVFIIVCTIGYALWIRGNNNKVKVIDGCEYIQNYNGHGWNLTHKGNCTNIYHVKK